MRDLIEKQLSDLRQKSFSELHQLEGYHGEKINENGKSFTISIWKDEINNNEIRIVVQVYRYWFLGFGKMDADGFRINNQGEINSLTKDEIYEFI